MELITGQAHHRDVSGIVEPTPDLIDEKFVHVHIPKTGGTSLRRMFEAEFGRENVLLFNHETGRLLRSDERQLTVPNRYVGLYEKARQLSDKAGLTSFVSDYIQRKRVKEATDAGHDLVDAHDLDFRVVTGHLDADSIQAAGLDSYPIVTVVRHPLDRAISFYKHWRRTQGSIFGEFFEDMVPDATSFEDVALSTEQQNFQSRWLAGLTLERVGVTEYLSTFMGSIGMSGAANKPVFANRDPSPHGRPVIDHDFLQEFEQHNSDDYELYYSSIEQQLSR